MGATIRDAVAADAEELAALIHQLGYPCTAAQAEARRSASIRAGGLVLVATMQGKVVGFVALQPLPMMHEDPLWGRISALVVGEGSRGQGIGDELLREVERRGTGLGIGRFEVASGDQRVDAHRFYRTRGYQEPHALRFLKPNG